MSITGSDIDAMVRAERDEITDADLRRVLATPAVNWGGRTIGRMARELHERRAALPFVGLPDMTTATPHCDGLGPCPLGRRREFFNDDTGCMECDVCPGDAVLEMQAIRLALRAMAEEVAAAHDEMGVACTPVEVLHDHNLPPSVVAWVLAEGGA